MPWARILADAIVVVHLAYVSFVVLGMVAILLGLSFQKSWARNPWFRLSHLTMIGVVVIESALGIPCPLTVWERQLRQAAGQRAYTGDFVGYWSHRLIFFQAPPWAFTLAYCLFGAVVLLTFVLAPPRRNRSRPSATQGGGSSEVPISQNN